MDQVLVSTFIASEEPEELNHVISTICLNITAKTSALADLVGLLGQYLTQEDSIIRSKATKCLSQVLAGLPLDTLNKQQLNVISAFFVERMYDSDSLDEILIGLHASIIMKNFSSTNIESILKSMNQNINMRKHVQTTRYEVFLLLKTLYEIFGSFIGKNLGNIFISTYCSLSSGEKDPRNLMISFNICKIILRDLDSYLQESKQLVDDIFDVTFCYFPITFEPPKNDPYGITSDDLRIALRDVISQNGILAKYTIPGLIEKLTSTIPSIKQDILLTLGACMDKYDTKTIESIWQEVWDGIKYEILHGSDDEITVEAANVLCKMGQSLSNDSTDLDKYLDSVQKETKGKLEEAQSKLSTSAAILVSEISKSSVKAFEVLIDFAIPLLLKGFIQSPALTKQKAIIDILFKFLNSTSEVDKRFDNKGHGILERFKDDIIGILSKALMGSDSSETALRLSALNSLNFLVIRIPGYLTDAEIGLISQYLDTIILEDTNDNIIEAALKSQLEISRIKPSLLSTTTFPALFAALSNDKETNVNTSKSYDFILYALTYLIETKNSLEILSVRLLNKLDENINDERYSIALLTALYKALLKFDKNDNGLLGYTFKFMPRLISKIYEKNEFFNRNIIIQRIAAMMIILVKNTNENEQEEIAKELLNLFVIEDSESKFVKKSVEKYLGNNESSPTNLVHIFVAGLTPMNRDKIPEHLQAEILNNALRIIHNAQSPFIRLGYLRLIGLICNKWIDDSIVQIKVNELIEKQPNIDHLEIIGWICKSLIMKNDTLGYEILQKHILNHLDEEGNVGISCARLIGIIASDDVILNKQNGSIVRKLYRQRLFLTILPNIVKGFQLSVNHKSNYIVALSGLLKYTSSQIISNQLETFIPLLLESLHMEDSNVLKAAIDTITVTMTDNSAIFKQHLNVIIKQLLRLAKENDTETIRIVSLNALSLLALTFEVRYLHPYQKQVIKQLELVLDDKKRRVRKAASICRQSYYEIGMEKS